MIRFSSTGRWTAALLALWAAGALAQPKDSDGDGVPDAIDNCVAVYNPGQQDGDGDGIGNACDGDFNNDGKVDDLDVAYMKQKLGSDDPAADLDGSGKVDDTDVALLRRLLGQPPGPSGLPLDASFGRNPPLATSVQILALSPVLKDGRNAIVLADFSAAFLSSTTGTAARPPASIVLSVENGLAVLNDLGVQGDEKAGDGIFTGLVRIDPDAAKRDAESFLLRARNSKADAVTLFNRREVVGNLKFDVADAFEPATNERRFSFTLPLLGEQTVLATPLPRLRLLLPPSTDPARTLLVRDLGVVQDPARTFSPCTPAGAVAPFGNPAGAWSFRTLMSHMANPAVSGISPQVFVNDWLKKWLSTDSSVKHSDGSVLAFNIPARPALQAIVNSLQPAWNPAVPSSLDLDKLPFRLLAIVNRIDLAEAVTYGPGSPGELRFVFGLLERQGNACVPAPMTVILEYKVPTTRCAGLRTLARQWIALDALVPGSAAYNAQLQALTDQVSVAGAFPGQFNASAIGQVRTNEVRLSLPWELREFTLQASPIFGKLLHTSVKQTPDKSLNRTAVLSDFIANPQPNVPVQHLGVDFLGAAIQYGPGAAPANPPWNGNPLNGNAARFQFSLNTCSGCHLSETGTSFTMVSPNGPLNASAQLARFLTGTATTAPFTPISDPEYGTPSRHFNDLRRRGQQLDQLAAKSCFRLLELPVLQDASLSKLPNGSVFAPGFVH